MAAPTSLYPLLGDSSGPAVYISPTGDDTTGNGTRGQEWKSPEKARDNVAANGRVFCRYAGGADHRPLSGERVTWQKNGGSRSDPITICTDPQDNPNYLTGANVAKFRGEFLAGGSGTVAFSNLKITDLDIRSTPGTTRLTPGVEGVKAENFTAIEIARCRIHDTIEQAIHPVGSGTVAQTTDWHAHHNLIWNIGSDDGTGPPSTNNHDHGFYIENAFNGQAFDNIVYDCHWGSCCQFFPSSTGNLVCFNTFYDTSGLSSGTVSIGNAVSFFYGTSGVGQVDNNISSNIFARSRQDATTRLAVETSGTLGAGTNRLFKNLAFQITNSGLWGSSTLWINNATRAADNLGSADPMWADVVAGDLAHRDFRILSGSPCIQQGETNVKPPTDFFGNPRVHADVGASAYLADDPSGIVIVRSRIIRV